MKNTTLLRLALFFLAAPVGDVNAVEADRPADQILSVWPESSPDWDAPTDPEGDSSTVESGTIAGRPLIRLANVTSPQLHVYRPTVADTGTVVIVCPGGGFHILAWDLEGTEIAHWLQSVGVTAVVLKYRVPHNNSETKWLAAVQDLQRAVGIVRSGKIESVKPKRLGVLGFSAGANASLRMTLSKQRFYQPVDAADQVPLKPDFAILVYPAWLVKEDDPSSLLDELKVDTETPPMFLTHAADDKHDCFSCVSLFTALHQNKVPSSLHVFSSGGHGFGGRITGKPTDAWRGLCTDWMRTGGWLSP